MRAIRPIWNRQKGQDVSEPEAFMDDREMTIREMCDAFDVTPRTLRFYEQKELLFPRRDGQKRLFSKRDRGRLKLILRGKRFGFSLEEIRQLLELYDVGDQQQRPRAQMKARQHSSSSNAPRRKKGKAANGSRREVAMCCEKMW